MSDQFRLLRLIQMQVMKAYIVLKEKNKSPHVNDAWLTDMPNWDQNEQLTTRAGNYLRGKTGGVFLMNGIPKISQNLWITCRNSLSVIQTLI